MAWSSSTQEVDIRVFGALFYATLAPLSMENVLNTVRDTAEKCNTQLTVEENCTLLTSETTLSSTAAVTLARLRIYMHDWSNITSVAAGLLLLKTLLH